MGPLVLLWKVGTRGSSEFRCFSPELGARNRGFPQGFLKLMYLTVADKEPVLDFLTKNLQAPAMNEPFYFPPNHHPQMQQASLGPTDDT